MMSLLLRCASVALAHDAERCGPSIVNYSISSLDIVVLPEIHDVAQCCVSCTNPSKCTAFTVNASGCALKNTTAGLKPATGSTSGVLSPPSPPPPPPCPPGKKFCAGSCCDYGAECCGDHICTAPGGICCGTLPLSPGEICCKDAANPYSCACGLFPGRPLLWRHVHWRRRWLLWRPHGVRALVEIQLLLRHDVLQVRRVRSLVPLVARVIKAETSHAVPVAHATGTSA